MSLQDGPRVVGVDLTPVLPGGENGGAKIFVLELVRQLGRLAPQTKFILLTSARSNDELAALDAPNISRQMVLGLQSDIGGAGRIAQRVLSRVPRRLRGLIARASYRLYASIKRFQARRRVSSGAFDLLFCPFTAPTFYDPRIPTVSTIYDLQYKTFPAFFSPQDVAHRDMTFRDACQKATLLVAISNYSRASAIAHGGLAPDRIRTIYLQMALRVGEPGAAPLAALGLQKQRYFVYPANFWKHKNHEMALTAFGMACARGIDQDLKLVFTGAPGERRDYLADCAKRLGLGERAVFAGFLDEPSFTGLLADSLGLFFPSLYEGFGLPVIEAMASGVPVACSNVASLPEVAGEAALTFNPRIPEEMCAALLELASGTDRAKLVTRGYEQSRAFTSSERMAQEYWDLFREALGRTNHITAILGLHDDGWCSGQIKLLIEPKDSGRKAEFAMHCPKWVPAPRVEVLDVTGKVPVAVAEIGRGTTRVWSTEIPPGASTLAFELKTPFVPAFCGLGSDQRELTLVLERCDLLGLDGSCQAVFPANSAGEGA